MLAENVPAEFSWRVKFTPVKGNSVIGVLVIKS
jgi:hypothetical protein